MHATFTKFQLLKALERWETEAREGKSRSREETEKLPVEQVAQEAADHLWKLLTGK